MLFLQDKNQLTVSGRADGGQPWADSASARKAPPSTAQYAHDPLPECAFVPPGTVTEMDNGYRKLTMGGMEGTVVEFDPSQPELLVRRNNFNSRM